MGKWSAVTAVAATIVCAGCTGSAVTNPFLTAAEAFGNASNSTGNSGSGSGGGSTSTTARFRDTMTLTLANAANDANAELNTTLLAWVNASSVRSGDQQEALLNGEFVRLTSDLKVGSALTLPVGTWVYSAGRAAGTYTVKIAAGGSDAIDLITPDGVLLYSQPPDSCDSVAFYFTVNGFLLDQIPGPEGTTGVFLNATTSAPRKTLAQVDAYECTPRFRPGLYLRQLGSVVDPSLPTNNLFNEADPITVTFSLVAQNNVAATVQIGG